VGSSRGGLIAYFYRDNMARAARRTRSAHDRHVQARLASSADSRFISLMLPKVASEALASVDLRRPRGAVQRYVAATVIVMHAGRCGSFLTASYEIEPVLDHPLELLGGHPGVGGLHDLEQGMFAARERGFEVSLSVSTPGTAARGPRALPRKRP
jgi:hypothetical protein